MSKKSLFEEIKIKMMFLETEGSIQRCESFAIYILSHYMLVCGMYAGDAVERCVRAHTLTHLSHYPVHISTSFYSHFDKFAWDLVKNVTVRSGQS